MNSDSSPVALSLQERLRQAHPRLPATWTLVAINLGVFAAMLFHGAGLWHTPNAVQMDWGANFGPATKDGEWWRLGSALFLHFGLLHLGMNMTALAEAGTFVERMIGSRRFVAVYFLGGLLGNLLSLIAQGDRAVAGGASGAIFGLYGALIYLLWTRRHQVDRTEFRWLFGGAIGFSLLTVSMGFLITGIDNAAHLGGLCGGVLAGIALASPPDLSPDRLRRRRGLAGIALAAAFVGLAIAIPPPRYHWHEELEAREAVSQVLGEERQIGAAWDSIATQGREGATSFEALAGRVDAEIGDRYEETFEQLSSLKLSPEAPSAQAVESLRRYVAARREASRELAEGLREHDRLKIINALEKVRRTQPNGVPAGKPPETSPSKK